MIANILRADAIYDAPSPQALAEKHARMIAKKRLRGIRLTPTVISTPQVASINHGRWLFDCACGSGVGAHPEWSEARCFGCGNVYTTVVYPADRDAIEAALVERVDIGTRNWTADESVAHVQAETLAMKGDG